MLDEFQRDEALIHFQRGLVLEQANRVQEAVEEYRRALAHNPNMREAHDALGFYYQRYGLLAKAAEEFRFVASLENDFLSHFNLGYVLIELARYDEALIAFQRCLVLEPGDPATHYEIALLHSLRGHYQQALDQLQVTLHAYPEDWESHHLAGRCHLQLGHYESARAAFDRALRNTRHPATQILVLDQLARVDRYSEIGRPANLKERLYAEHGVVCLGSAQDDGLNLSEIQDYHFTYPDIGVTLRRLRALADGCGWQLSCLVPLDRLSQPLSRALEHLLGLPSRSAAELTPADRPLLVLGVGREAELLGLALERMPCVGLTFCLGLNWLRHKPVLPDVTGVIARGACSVPWESELRRLRADGAAPALIDGCIQRASLELLAAVHAMPDEHTRQQQIDYHTRRFRRLRFGSIVAPATSPALL
ncbi:MAG: tetratricopeptide repeat protein [Roseiflexaceae bacterium]